MTALILFALVLAALRARYVWANPSCDHCGRRFRRDSAELTRYWLTPLHRSWVCVWCQLVGRAP